MTPGRARPLLGLRQGTRGPTAAFDLCALAAVNFAEAQRLLRDPITAEDFLRLAVDWQLSGTLRPRIARRVATLEARILRDRGRHEEALDRLLRETAILEATAPAPDANLLGWFFGHWRQRADLDELRRASNAPGER